MGTIPETHVLAIASHVTYGYVGNTMAVFVMQSLGCEVSAINTVNFSNHTAYKQVKGRKTPAEEVSDLYVGLRDSNLNDFDMMLSGYCPSAAVVQEVGKIAREKRFKATTKPGSFFWVLDPVMGDEGRIYVSEDVVPAYKSLLRDADLILPNQFEAELLSGIQITDYTSLASAIRTLHSVHRVPHIIITSVRLPSTAAPTPQDRSGATSPDSSGQSFLAAELPKLSTSDASRQDVPKLSIIGSTASSDMTPRLFRLTVPALPVFFSGTGDMFAALMVARLRQACQEADLLEKPNWRSPDDVEATDLPLAKAAEKVLASMHAVLEKTMQCRQAEERTMEEEKGRELNVGTGEEAGVDQMKERHLRLTKAAEVRVVRNARDLIDPPGLEGFRAQCVVVDVSPEPQAQPDELGVVRVGTGEGAVHQT